MAEAKWEKIVARRTDIQKGYQFVIGLGIYLPKIFGTTPLSHQLLYFDGRTTHYFGLKGEYKSFQHDLKKLFTDLGFVSNLGSDVEILYRDSLKEGQKLIKGISSKSGNEDLLASFNNFEILWTRRVYAYGWFLFFISMLDNVVCESLKTIFDESRVQTFLKIISQPYLLTPIMQCERDIVELAKGNKNAEDLAKKYGWMSVYNFDDKPRTAEHYTGEAKKLTESGADLDKILEEKNEARRLNEEKYKNILKYVSNPLIKAQIELLHQAGFLRDWREELRDRLTIIETELYIAIANKYGFSLQEIINMTSSEIRDLLSTKILDPSVLKTAAVRRLKRYAGIFTNESLKLYDRPDDIDKIIDQISVEMTEELKGNSVSTKGIFIGIAKIVQNNRELDKVGSGDVLVAGMTKPDYVNAMKNALAFVTDEGGVTCHAAIVARELKKPCIVGTRIATQVLKDGDLVEVDAEKGVVKIIKKANG